MRNKSKKSIQALFDSVNTLVAVAPDLWKLISDNKETVGAVGISSIVAFVFVFVFVYIC